MNRDETDMIENLFSRLAAADRSEKDKEALNLINAKISANPNAAYLLVQTVLIQEAALKSWQERAQQLEAENAASKNNGRNFLPATANAPNEQARTSLWRRPMQAFNRGQSGQQGYPPNQGFAPAGAYPPNYGPNGGFNGGYGNGGFMGGGGGFLGSALTTAAGVAGGMLLYNGISNMFSSGSSASNAGVQNSAHEAGAGQSANNYDQVNDTGSGVDPAGGADYSQASYDGGGYGNDFGGDMGGFDSGEI